MRLAWSCQQDYETPLGSVRVRSNRPGIADALLGPPLARSLSEASVSAELRVFLGKRRGFLVSEGQVVGQSKDKEGLRHLLGQKVLSLLSGQLSRACRMPGRVEIEEGRYVLVVDDESLPGNSTNLPGLPTALTGFSTASNSPSVMVVDDGRFMASLPTRSVTFLGQQIFPAENFRLASLQLHPSIGSPARGPGAAEMKSPHLSLLRASSALGMERGEALELLCNLLFECANWSLIEPQRSSVSTAAAPSSQSPSEDPCTLADLVHERKEVLRPLKRPGLIGIRKHDSWIVLAPQGHRPIVMNEQAYALLDALDGTLTLEQLLLMLEESNGDASEGDHSNLRALIVDLWRLELLEMLTDEVA